MPSAPQTLSDTYIKYNVKRAEDVAREAAANIIKKATLSRYSETLMRVKMRSPSPDDLTRREEVDAEMLATYIEYRETGKDLSKMKSATRVDIINELIISKPGEKTNFFHDMDRAVELAIKKDAYIRKQLMPAIKPHVDQLNPGDDPPAENESIRNLQIAAKNTEAYLASKRNKQQLVIIDQLLKVYADDGKKLIDTLDTIRRKAEQEWDAGQTKNSPPETNGKPVGMAPAFLLSPAEETSLAIAHANPPALPMITKGKTTRSGGQAA